MHSVDAAITHRGSAPFGACKRLFLRRHSSCLVNMTENMGYNSSGTVWRRSCRVCNVDHWSNDSPRILFLGDQSILAVVKRLDYARLIDLVDHMNILLRGRMTHLGVSSDSIIAMFSLADLVSLHVHGYMIEFQKVQELLTELVNSADSQVIGIVPSRIIFVGASNF